ncbi:flagellar protein FlgN [Litchfieldia salsa]|uniref:FlgN protein n=1 Tax=Litchfieldia salsa TaxID=930152 RepID=A0A1H0WWG0_9BACI|nr:flagellar protein FlgN [Litchfieldia salsa]SDP95041.1 FlgN protein [Litchfieldia salsa]
MSATKIIDLLRKLLTLHSALHQLAMKKTEILKTGDIPSLDEHLKEEQKYILAIRQIEHERVEIMQVEFHRLGTPQSDQTLTKYIETINEPERTNLIQLQQELVEKITQLKTQNELNQQLTSQSLQVVNMTLDTILPKPKELNYGNPLNAPQEKNTQRRSMFDSQA